MAKTALAQAIRNAVEAELAAERFYRELAESTQDDESRAFLLKMANQESEHAKAMERFGEQVRAGDLPFAADFNVEFVESAPQWAFAQEMSYEQALNVALENEQRAELYYGTLAETTRESVADFFKKVAQVEQQHVEILEKIVSDK